MASTSAAAAATPTMSLLDIGTGLELPGIVGNISTGKTGTGKGGNFPWKGKMGQILFQWEKISSGIFSSGSR
jgi:hypothetical protein